MKRGIAKEEEMKLGKKTVVTIGVLLSALLCVNSRWEYEIKDIKK